MMKKRILSISLAIVLLFSMIHLTSFATEGENEGEYVYISVSYDDKFKEDKTGKPIAYVPVSFEELAYVDLDAYGLSDYWYDENGDGTYETTALQLIIYAHEELYGGDFSEVSFTGGPGSSYFQGGLFGQDENLNYYLNGQYPLAGAGWGATSDQIVLEPGDVISLAGFTSWDFFYDSGYGFHYFADENGDMTHFYTAEEGKACDIKLIKGTKDIEYNSVFLDVSNYTVYYGTELYNETGSVTTDGDACTSITFPSAGTWYLWADGGYGNEFPEAIVSAPGYAEVTVTEAVVQKTPLEQAIESANVSTAIIESVGTAAIIQTQKNDTAMTVDELYAMFNGNTEITITSNDGKIGTGSKISLGEEEIEIVIKGDIDGDGITTVFDALLAKKSMTENIPQINDLREFAGDVDGNTGISDNDVDKLLSHIVGESYID